MAILSNAVDQTAVARVTGYALGFKDFAPVASNLPQRVAFFTTVGADKDSGFTEYNTPIPVNSVKLYCKNAKASCRWRSRDSSS
jgi:hypothetical protein